MIFNCHHGPNECYGNKVHACAIENIQVDSFQQTNTRESLTLEYVNCLMKFALVKEGLYPLKSCAEQTGVDRWENILQCANSTDGSKLLQKFGDQTNALQKPLVSVPTVAVKQTYDSSFQSKAVDNLRDALCSRLTPSPELCLKSGVSVVIPTIFLTFGAFLLSRFF